MADCTISLPSSSTEIPAFLDIQQQNKDEEQQSRVWPMECDVYHAALSGSEDKLNSRPLWKDQKTPLGNNVIHVHVGRPFKGKLTSRKVNISFIDYILEKTAQNSFLLQTNDDGDTPLHLAAKFGHEDAVEAFIRFLKLKNLEGICGLSELINKSNGKKDTALHEAARAGHTRVVELLVEAVSGNSDHHEPNCVSETPLFLAAEKGCVGCFSTILQDCKRLGLALDQIGPCGQTALHVAVLCRNKDIVMKILEHDWSLIRVKNAKEQTLLHCAAAQNVEDLSILEILLSPNNSAAYIQDNKGQTPLHLATLSWSFRGVKKIIESYPDCIEIKDNIGQNVVHYAANLGCLQRFRGFLKYAPSCDRLLNHKDQNGDTPLHILAATTPTMPSHDCFLHLEEFVKQYDYILDVNVYNNQNVTAGDIIASNASLRHFAAVPPREMSKILPRNRRRNSGVYNGDANHEIIQNVDNSKLEERNVHLKKVEDKISSLKKANETRLVVAALISTVSFTAGFTIPGGYQSTIDNTGMAVLAKKAAFQAFLVSDSIAFTLSSLAIICYFVAARDEALVSVDNLSISAHLLNSISLGALMVAFLTGVCAVVTNSPGLVIIVIVISLFYFFFYLSLLLGTFDTLLAFMTRNSWKKARE